MGLTASYNRAGIGRRRAGIGGRRLTAAVVLSRVIAAAAGVIGATQFHRVRGWHVWDWQRLTQHLGSVGDALAGSAVRWDSIHYLDIAAYGYRARANTVFFPLYPLLIKVGGAILQSDVIAGVVISLIAFAIALVLLHRLTVEELGVPAADATVLVLVFAPLSFFFSAVYTESLFLALSLGAFYAARHERWMIAGLCAAAAAITRVPGVLLIVPLGLLWWNARERPTSALWLALPAIALAAFLLYLHHRGYGLLAPITNQETLHFHTSSGPIVTIVDAIRDGVRGFRQTVSGVPAIEPGIGSPFSLPFANLVELVVFIISMIALVSTFRRLPFVYGVYAGLVLLLCVWSPYRYEPLRSFDRYVLVIFPLWMVAGDWFSRRRILLPVAAFFGAGVMVFYVIEFARWSFVA